MADLRNQSIVLLGRDDMGYCANRFCERRHFVYCIGRSGANRAKKERCIFEEIGMSGVWSRLFETRHRMSTDEIEAEALRLVANRGLRTSHVRNERGSLRNLIEQTEYLSDRR